MKNRDMPAMPVIDDNGVFIQEGLPSIGLTKREYFAGLSMQGLLVGEEEYDQHDIATMAVAHSDALLKALENTSES